MRFLGKFSILKVRSLILLLLLLVLPILVSVNHGSQARSASKPQTPAGVSSENQASVDKATVSTADPSPPTLSYAKTWGGAGNDIAQTLAFDSAGNLYVSGWTGSFGVGASDVFLLKYAPSGTIVWQRTWGGEGDDVAQGMSVDATGNVYVTGHTTGFGSASEDIFLVKFSSAGDLVWQRIWGGTGDDEGFGVAIDSSNNIYVTGHTSSSGAGGSDALLLKFDSGGGLIWQKTWGGGGDETAVSVAVSSTESIYMTGYTTSFGAGGPDAFLLKYDQEGNLLWQRTWGGVGADFGSSVAADLAENAYVTGNSRSMGSGANDVFLLKFTPAGNLVWERLWGGAGDDIANGVSTNPSGDIQVTGSTTSLDTGNQKIFLLRYSSAGNLLWQQTLASSNGDGSNAVIADASGGVLGAGYVNGPPPYTSSSPSLSSSTPTLVPGTIGSPSLSSLVPVRVPSGAVTNPSGSTSYAGGQDALVFKFQAPTIPSPPLNLQAANSIGGVNLNWSPPSSNGGAPITGYRVYRGTMLGGESQLATIGGGTSYVDTSVLGGTSYYYELTALNALGESVSSNEVAIISLPAAPEALQAQGGIGLVTLTWRPPSVNGGVSITGYNVFRGASSGGESLLVSLGDQLTYDDRAVTGGVTYFYEVAAVNPSGQGALSNEAIPVPPVPQTAPSAPLELMATAQGGVVYLSWNPPTTNGGSPILGYYLYRGAGQPLAYVLYRVLSNQTAFTVDDGTDCLFSYGYCFFYRVTAFNALGEGPSSNEANPRQAAPLSAFSMTSMAIIFLSVVFVTLAVKRLRV